LQFPERLLFGLQVGLDVHVSGIQAFVAKPKSDRFDFGSGLKKVHRRGVATWGEILLVLSVGQAGMARRTAC